MQRISEFMVSFKQFKSLEEGRQAEILWSEGVYLELIRHTSHLNVELYALSDFYVELYFDTITEDPLFLKPIDKVAELSPYLDMIDISDLIKSNSGSC